MTKPVKPWYPKDPDLVGRVARIVRLRRNRRLWRARRFLNATDLGVRAGGAGYIQGWEDGSQWAIAQMRDEYRRERQHVFELVEQRRMVTLGRDAGEVHR